MKRKRLCQLKPPISLLVGEELYPCATQVPDRKQTGRIWDMFIITSQIVQLLSLSRLFSSFVKRCMFRINYTVKADGHPH